MHCPSFAQVHMVLVVLQVGPWAFPVQPASAVQPHSLAEVSQVLPQGYAPLQSASAAQLQIPSAVEQTLP